VGMAQQITKLYLQLVEGTGLRVTNYPANAVGAATTGSGNGTGAYKYKAAGAQSKAIVAAGGITSRYKIIGTLLDTPSAASIFLWRLGRGTAAGAAIAAVLAEVRAEVATDAGGYPHISLPYAATVPIDGVNDALIVEMTSSNAAADDTANISASVLTGLGS